MNFPPVVLFEGTPMHIYLYLYSEFPIPPLLYYHPGCYGISHHRPWVYFSSLLKLRSTTHMTVLINYPTSMFLLIIYIFLLNSVLLFYLDKLYLAPLVTSHDPLLYIKLMTQFYVEVDVIPVTAFYRFYHTLYMYLPFERCILSRHLLISQKTCFCC